MFETALSVYVFVCHMFSIILAPVALILPPLAFASVVRNRRPAATRKLTRRMPIVYAVFTLPLFIYFIFNGLPVVINGTESFLNTFGIITVCALDVSLLWCILWCAAAVFLQRLRAKREKG